jgi:hypothetical protein
MMKVAFGVLLAAAAFGGVLYAGGNVMGAWEPHQAAPSPESPNAAPRPEAPAQPPSRRRPARAKPARPRKTTPRDARWIRRANALCRAARRDALATRQPRTLEEMETFLARGTKDNKRWNARFLELGAPRGDASRFRRLRALLREDERLLSETAAAVRDRDGAALLMLSQELVSIAEEESSLLVSMGARACALPPGLTT